MSTESQQLIELVNKQVANWTVLYTKLHNFHWYVKGPNFFTLHANLKNCTMRQLCMWMNWQKGF